MFTLKSNAGRNLRYSMKNIFPVTIDIRRNPYFFAKIDWLLWRLFKRKPKHPCGRQRKEKYLCCCQPLDNDRVYLSDVIKSQIIPLKLKSLKGISAIESIKLAFDF